MPTIRDQLFVCWSCKLEFIPKCVACRSAPRTMCPRCKSVAVKKSLAEPADSPDIGLDVPGGGATP